MSRLPQSDAQSARMSESTPHEIDNAVNAAVDAFDQWACTEAAPRAALLRALATALEAQREQLVPLADEETNLGPARLNGELDRTAFQLRAFADAVEDDAAYPVMDDAAVAAAPPAGHPRLMRVALPLGPVAMFSASNFPFAFSVLGGDTASALAAGCSVVIKAHPAHPRLSRAVAALACGVVADTGAPSGLLTMVEGASKEVGMHLVSHPDIAAVAFTGSFHGGAALQKEVNARTRPIPFFGELGSINPVVALPSAIAAQSAELANTLAASIAQGSGQFCTSPGVLLVLDNEESDRFVIQLAQALDLQTPHAMLSPAIREGFEQGVTRIGSHASARLLTRAAQGIDGKPTPALFDVDSAVFLGDAALREEVFGPFCVVVRLRNAVDMTRVLKAVGGSLTVTIWGGDENDDETREIVRSAMRIAGRVLFSGVPTGVAVTRAQHHGGPWPASTQPQTTSVGLAAMQRFLRPVALQDLPQWLVQRKGVPC